MALGNGRQGQARPPAHTHHTAVGALPRQGGQGLIGAVRAQTCFEQDSQGMITASEICGATEAVCNASAWKTHYENFHPIQINNIVSSLSPLSLFPTQRAPIVGGQERP